MLVTQIERGYHCVGVHVNTNAGIASGWFDVYEDGQRVDTVKYDANVQAVDEAMNGAIPETATTPYEVVATIIFGLALQTGYFKGTLVSLNAPLPQSE